jgi:hypothetical protein
MYILIKNETSIRLRRLDIEILKDTLSTAKSFFATSTIPFKEWFDPVSQIYFSTIINRQFQDTTFYHARVFLFFKESDIKNLDSVYLDGYYSKCIADMHLNYNIPAGFLKRDEILNILGRLIEEDKKALGCYRFWIPYWVSWRQGRRVKKIYLSRLRCRPDRLDFAFVELLDGSKCVLHVSKHGQDVRIEKIEEVNRVSPYENLITAIKNELYLSGSSPLRIQVEHDFTKLSPIG